MRYSDGMKIVFISLKELVSASANQKLVNLGTPTLE
jgi:hypothetical protein